MNPHPSTHAPHPFTPHHQRATLNLTPPAQPYTHRRRVGAERGRALSGLWQTRARAPLKRYSHLTECIHRVVLDSQLGHRTVNILIDITD